MTSINRPFFRHFVIEVKVDAKNVDSIPWLKNKVENLLSQLKITYVKDVYHQFIPSGISLIYILSTSHLAVHSWPENDYMHIDLVTCSKSLEFESIYSVIESVFNTRDANVLELAY